MPLAAGVVELALNYKTLDNKLATMPVDDDC
jgi:hypothetical protein